MPKKQTGFSLPIETLFYAAEDLLKAKDAKAKFEKDHPNDSTKKWDAHLYAVEACEVALRKAIDKAREPALTLRPFLRSTSETFKALRDK